MLSIFDVRARCPSSPLPRAPLDWCACVCCLACVGAHNSEKTTFAVVGGRECSERGKAVWKRGGWFLTGQPPQGSWGITSQFWCKDPHFLSDLMPISFSLEGFTQGRRRNQERARQRSSARERERSRAGNVCRRVVMPANRGDVGVSILLLFALQHWQIEAGDHFGTGWAQKLTAEK